MGRLIDADKFIKDVERDRKHEIYLHSWTADMVLKRLDSWYAPTVEAIPKADYDTRLKADMVAMLKELQSEINESDSRAGYAGNGMPTFSTDYIRKKKVNELIRRKINELKGKVRDNE